MSDPALDARLSTLDFPDMDTARAVTNAVGEPQAVQIAQANAARRMADALTRIATATEELIAIAREERESA